GVTGLGAGDNVFRWTIENGVCADSFDDITITIVEEPSMANAGADQTVCEDPGTATLTGNDPAVGTGTWTLVSGTGTITDASAFNSGVTGLAAGDNVFRWTISTGGCIDSFDDITITVDAEPSTADAGPDQTVCEDPGTATLAGNNPLVGTGVWTVVAGGGTVTVPGDFNSGVTGLSAGVNTFRWTVSNGVCTDSFDEVTITMDEAPSTADAGADQEICDAPGTATLAGNDPAVGTGTWTLVSGTGTITDVSAFNSGVTALGIGDNVFRWTISNGVCADSFDEITITVNEAPTTANAGIDQTLCSDPGTATLAGNDPAIGTGVWTVITGGATVTTPADFNSGVTGLTVGVNTFRWTISNGACTDSFDEITINVDEAPTASAAGDDQELCFVTTSTLEGNDPAIGTGAWTVITGGASVTDATAFDSEVTGLTLGTNTFVWTISNGVCAVSTDTIVILITEDNDGDGVCDAEDLDSDNDGVSDIAEGDDDTDGDGIPDYLDLDSDNDGIPDLVEAGGTDADGDGLVDDFEDLDGDGLDDATDTDPLPNPDSDGDGIDDSKDLDSDNDGTPDITEAGGIDADGDGVLDDLTDTDGDGFGDVVDTNDDTVPGDGDGGTALTNPDTDGDGVDDRLDLDSDNDGIADVIENGGTDADGDGILDDFADVDGDGFSDIVDTDDNTVPGAGDGGTTLPNGDFDMDGIPNNLDLDSDNDGIVDVIEGGGTDVDGNGVLDDFTDVDGDGFSDVVDTDDNTVLGTGDGGTALPLPNTDGEGGANYLDIDADGDGIIDNIEGQTTADYIAPTGTDSDGDGIDDAYDIDESGTPIVPNNHDGDVNADYVDTDSDNDGESDLIEGHDLDGDGVADTTPSGDDTDNDGLDDAFDTTVLTDLTAGTNGGNGTVDPFTDGVLADADTPGAGNLDFREVDTDGDGVDDSVDLDSDNDGIPDVAEGDGDTDGDGIPDYLDLDSDNDGIPDIIEAGGTDNDGDGLLDVFEDLDGDGLDDATDADPLPNPDSDGDGIDDTKDLDSDNDGTPDITEAGGTDVDGDGILDDLTDTDGDGFGDIVDTDDNTIPGGGDGGISLANPDTDSDGVDDRIDLDSDNDGIADVIENGGTDADGDGVLDDFADVDGDGFSDVVDTDDNTVPGAGDGGTTLPNGDFDMDGIPNNLDLDSDNDGIVDAIEGGGTDADGNGILDDFTDVDGDGFSDVVDTDDNTVLGAGDGGTALPLPNTDGEGGANYLDIDADGDGIIDNIEGQATADYIAPTGTDSDGDGIDNAYDIDESGTPIVPNNHDGDANADYVDSDSDNDGESDLLEGHDLDGDGVADTTPSGDDTDGDGLDDAFDTIELTDLTAGINGGNGTVDPFTDGVLADADAPGIGNLDFRELDSDGDGIDDLVDLDDDNDGIPDDIEGDGDTDGDGIPDSIDLDSDNDGIPDLVEAGGTDSNGDGVLDVFEDLDGDGLDDDLADTPLTNPDSDGDGIVDAKDLDSDNDGTPDITEAGGIDADGDGVLDDITDTDGDGFADVVDTNDDTVPGEGDGGIALTNPDTDGDGVDDRLDLDSDNDGIADVIENGGTDADGDGVLDDFADV
ncbi:beta strand repeat-containing protein, partial [Crocinitomix catalasitica]|uniref:beta strand repeat-containing protein n=1 Tax=Crocinitomix catalasitica TaxID=184607 RepID=UPI0005642849